MVDRPFTQARQPHYFRQDGQAFLKVAGFAVFRGLAPILRSALFREGGE